MEGYVNILLLCDNVTDAELYKNLLVQDNRHDFNMVEVLDAKSAIKICHEESFDCILIDEDLQDSSGIQFIESLHQNYRYQFNSIVLIANEVNEEVAHRAIKNGAHDYIAKSQLSTEKLSDVIAKAIDRAELIKEIESQRKELERLAHHDCLTNLPNRLQFEESLKREVARSIRHGSKLALLFIDIDNFKSINDTMGHHIGDQLLIKVSMRLKSALRANDFIARLGGDEFAIIMTDFEQEHHAGVVARKIMNVLKKPHTIDNYEMTATASIGVALFPQSGEDAQTLLKNADIAMYRAKDSGKNNYQYHENRLNVQHQRRLNLENELRFAVERKQLYILYQPKYCLTTQTVIGLEALLRWEHPELGFVSPGEFIPIAEQTGLITPIGEWVIKTAIAEFADYKHQYNVFAGIHLSLNLSPKQFLQGNIVKLIEKTAKKENIEMRHLDFELTETAVMSQSKHLLKALQKLHEKGATITIDDFGTGYSSLSHLKLLPISGLKIDLVFVSGIMHDESDAIIVKAIINLAQSLELSVTAEGIETEEQRDYLKRNRCWQGQGYLFSKPVTMEEVVQLIVEEAYQKSVA